MEKTCFKCAKTLPIGDFYKHPFMGDGHLGKCKTCTRKDSEERRKRKEADPEWLEMERARHRKKARAMKEKYPEKERAHKAIASFQKSPDRHWHHWSYQKEHWRDVIALSPEDHRKAHRFMVYDQERMQYRRASDMVLLDSKELHLQYLAEIGCKPF